MSAFNLAAAKEAGDLQADLENRLPSAETTSSMILGKYLRDAIARIEQLEAENAELRAAKPIRIVRKERDPVVVFDPESE